MLKIKFLKPLMIKYYRWRYWKNLYSTMLKELKSEEIPLKNENPIPYINKPGIALTFDDSYRVNSWIKYGKELFGYYDIRVTFNINGVHPLENNREHSQDEVDSLLELQSNGHEIAHHGFQHQNVVKYSSEYGFDCWIEDEIQKLLNWMNRQRHSKTMEQFKTPVSFVFPHFVYNEETLNALVHKYFKIARGHLNKDNLTKFNKTGFVPSICLDGYYSYSLYYIKKIIRLAKHYNRNLVMTSHSIYPDGISSNSEHKYLEKVQKWESWRVSPKLLQAIINEARKNDMEFYSLSEIAGVATFLDKNLEKAIRKYLHNRDTKWIEIRELLEIKELDLSNKDITNLDGIQYFLNLERLDLSNNHIKDFRLIKKLKNLKYINIDNNSINDVKSEAM